MEERKLYFKKSKLWLNYFLFIGTVLFWIYSYSTFSHINIVNKELWVIYVLFVGLGISFTIWLIQETKNKGLLFSYNKKKLSFKYPEKEVFWSMVTDIDLNYSTFGKTNIVIFCKSDFPFYKWLFFSNNKIVSVLPKKIRIDMDSINCDNPEEIYHEMHNFLAQYKPLIEKEKF